MTESRIRETDRRASRRGGRRQTDDARADPEVLLREWDNLLKSEAAKQAAKETATKDADAC